MAAVAVAVAVVLIQGIGAGRNTPPSPSGQGQTSTSQAEGATLQPVAAHSFDPEGKGDQGDPAKQENENLAYLAIDRDPTTPWQTTHYKDKDITGVKGGVGLYLELRSPSHAAA